MVSVFVLPNFRDIIKYPIFCILSKITECKQNKQNERRALRLADNLPGQKIAGGHQKMAVLKSLSLPDRLPVVPDRDRPLTIQMIGSVHNDFGRIIELIRDRLVELDRVQATLIEMQAIESDDTERMNIAIEQMGFVGRVKIRQITGEIHAAILKINARI